MKEKGFDYHREMEFAEKYGIVKEVYETREEDSEHTYSIGGTKRRLVSRSEKPGVSPALLTDFLLDCSVFMRLSDISSKLPEFSEEVVTVKMSEEQRENYD